MMGGGCDLLGGGTGGKRARFLLGVSWQAACAWGAAWTWRPGAWFFGTPKPASQQFAWGTGPPVLLHRPHFCKPGCDGHASQHRHITHHADYQWRDPAPAHATEACGGHLFRLHTPDHTLGEGGQGQVTERAAPHWWWWVHQRSQLIDPLPCTNTHTHLSCYCSSTGASILLLDDWEVVTAVITEVGTALHCGRSTG